MALRQLSSSRLTMPSMSESALLVVHVTPRSGRDEVIGYAGGVLSVRLRAPPVGGKANASLVRLLAARLGVPARNVEIVLGASGRTKHVRILSMDIETAVERLTL